MKPFSSLMRDVELSKRVLSEMINQLIDNSSASAIRSSLVAAEMKENSDRERLMQIRHQYDLRVWLTEHANVEVIGKRLTELGDLAGVPLEGDLLVDKLVSSVAWADECQFMCREDGHDEDAKHYAEAAEAVIHLLRALDNTGKH